MKNKTIIITYLIYIIFWESFILGGCSYLVFWKDASFWWYTLACIGSASAYRPETWRKLLSGND